jgi:uncharacterized membrane protein YkoI
MAAMGAAEAEKERPMQTKPKSRAARMMLATLAGSLALGGAMATIARAEARSDDAATVQALGSAKISLADAIRTAEGAGQGMVVGGEFTMKDGKPVFNVITQNSTAEIDHLIDPATGAILGSTPDTEQANGDKESDEASELAALEGAKVKLLQAIATAEAQGGKALSAKYHREDGALAVELKVADASGKTTELRIDAATGSVAATGNDSGEEEGGEGGDHGNGEGNGEGGDHGNGEGNGEGGDHGNGEGGGEGGDHGNGEGGGEGNGGDSGEEQEG